MIHLIGLPHTSFDEETYSACAFTAKAVRWTRVLDRIDQAVTVYWGGGPVRGTSAEVVDCLSEAERLDWFGEDVATRLPDIVWHPELPYWSTFMDNAIREVRARIQPGDLVAIWAGSVMQRVVDAFPDHSVIEPAVGYGGLADGTFACFESYAWMHNRYGALGIDDGRAFDAVIPNFVEPDDFTTGADGGYALFLGRLISRKGPHAAADIAARAGLPLVVAGAGGVAGGPEVGWVRAEDGTEVPHCEYVGVVGPDRRRDLLAHASVLIVPTLYIEPFGTVHVEALASGVPVIASDWGVFTETVEQGVDGYRFRTPAQAAQQVHDAAALRGPALRARTLERFSLDAVAPRFDEWLWRVRSVRNGLDGWNAPHYGRR